MIGLEADSASADQTRVQGLGADIPTFLSLNRLALPLIVVIAPVLDDLRLSLTLPLIEDLTHVVMMMILVMVKSSISSSSTSLALSWRLES